MAEIYDDEAERAVLGCILTENRRLPWLRRLLTPEDFHAPAHQSIYAAMLSLADDGRPVDHLTVSERLKARGQLSGVGGPAYLMRLDEGVPLVSNLGDYAATVKDRSARRRLASIGRKLTELSANLQMNPTQLQAKASQHLLAADVATPRWKTLNEHLQGAYDHVHAVEAGTAQPVVPTGLAALDQVIGGWQPTLTIIAARTGVGKSAALATFIQNVARAGQRAAVFSLEDEGDWLAWRYLAYETGVNQFLLRYSKKTDAEWSRVAESPAAFEGWAERVLVDDRPGLTADEVVLAVDDAVANHGVQIVFIDHLKEMDHHAQRRERHDLNIEASLQKLRACQKRHRIPFVIAHQLTEDRENKTPTLSDFADGKVIGKMSRVAIALTRAQGSDEMDMHILKQTNGLSGRLVTVRFINGAAMIRDIEGRQPEEAPREEPAPRPLRMVRGGGYTKDPDEGKEDA